ncbi:hypothetical protein DOTSEDRAFT_69266 [Dothistroma septosporum NZE10]|uniref:Uncharacterized protein n=1 Tax=Dothistroma septosporum (strain NZE10 / CBS 128990) TaxID=675120 RepID=N1PUU4_DOTSN|nr:hypothetical protein DOTSEDRAFT_69266 [Dothistroma septosporum NZE10]
MTRTGRQVAVDISSSLTPTSTVHNHSVLNSDCLTLVTPAQPGQRSWSSWEAPRWSSSLP